MHFSQKGLTVSGLDSEKPFVESFGGDLIRSSKLNIKKKDIEALSLQVYLLERGA
jgi:hypothetical protein